MHFFQFSPLKATATPVVVAAPPAAAGPAVVATPTAAPIAQSEEDDLPGECTIYNFFYHPLHLRPTCN